MSGVAKVVIGSAILGLYLLKIFTDLLPYGAGFVLLIVSFLFFVYTVHDSFKEGERRRKAVDARIRSITTRAKVSE